MSRGAALLGWLEEHGPRPSTEVFLSPDRLPPIYGLAVGRKDGAAAAAGVCLSGIGEEGMGFVTGVPLACGLELLLKGSLAQRGVFAPESGAIDPYEFFTLLSTKGHSGDVVPASDSLLVSRSWDADVRESYKSALDLVRADHLAKTRDPTD